MILALDLEGTLVSNAMSQFPRPHLSEFMDFCRLHFEKIVLFTAVRKEKAMPIIQILIEEGEIPAFYKTMQYVHWKGKHKDLHFVQKMFPNTLIKNIYLVDDLKEYIAFEQEQQWFHIPTWTSPYLSEDTELLKLQGKMKNLLMLEQ